MNFDQPTNDFDEHEYGEDTSSAAFDDAMAREIVDEMVRRLKERRDLLLECLEYFDDRADADYSDELGRAVGNEEMHLSMRIRAVLGKEQA